MNETVRNLNGHEVGVKSTITRKNGQWIVGLVVDGNTYPVRQTLKEAGLRWDAARRVWAGEKEVEAPRGRVGEPFGLKFSPAKVEDVVKYYNRKLQDTGFEAKVFGEYLATVLEIALAEDFGWEGPRPQYLETLERAIIMERTALGMGVAERVLQAGKNLNDLGEEVAAYIQNR